GGERANPGLVVVLRTEIGEHRIGEMAFQQFRAPVLPIFQQVAQRFMARGITVATKQFTGSGRGAGTRIEQSDIGFAAAEGAVNKREVANHGSEKGETEAG